MVLSFQTLLFLYLCLPVFFVLYQSFWTFSAHLFITFINTQSSTTHFCNMTIPYKRYPIICMCTMNNRLITVINKSCAFLFILERKYLFILPSPDHMYQCRTCPSGNPNLSGTKNPPATSCAVPCKGPSSNKITIFIVLMFF